MYNSEYTSISDISSGIDIGYRSSIAFWTGSSIASGEGLVFAGVSAAISGADAGSTALLFNAPEVVTGDLSSFEGYSGHMKWDGCSNLEYVDVGGVKLEGLTVKGCENLSGLYADDNSMGALALNTLYDSLPDRRGLSAGTIDVSLNSGTGSHDSSIATIKNWSFV